MTINFAKKTIELTKAEMKEASKYGSDMYVNLMNARRDNPDYRTVEIKGRKVKTPLDNLNITTIRAYVKANGSADQKKDFLSISTSTITEEGVYIPAQSFFEIKKWFLGEFPQYKAALEAHNAEITRIFNAVDEKIAAAKKKIAEEAAADAKANLEIA